MSRSSATTADSPGEVLLIFLMAFKQLISGLFLKRQLAGNSPASCGRVAGELPVSYGPTKKLIACYQFFHFLIFGAIRVS